MCNSAGISARLDICQQINIPAATVFCQSHFPPWNSKISRLGNSDLAGNPSDADISQQYQKWQQQQQHPDCSYW